MVKYTFLLLLSCFFFHGCDTNSSMKIGGMKNQSYDKMGHLPEVPVQIDFCNEKLYFQSDDLKERLDAEIIFAQKDVAATTLILKRTKRYFPLIDSVLKANNLPLDLKYIAISESGLNPNEFRNENAGIWQLKEATAKEFGLTVTDQIDERFHIVKSTQAICDFFKRYESVFKDWPTRIVAYNRGVENVKIALNNQRTTTYFDTQFSPEASRYVFRIMALMLIIEAPDKYGFKLSDYDYYYPFKTQKVKVDFKMGNLKHWAAAQGINYKILRLLNPWILRETLPNGRSYDINLPNELSNLKPYEKNE